MNKIDRAKEKDFQKSYNDLGSLNEKIQVKAQTEFSSKEHYKP